MVTLLTGHLALLGPLGLLLFYEFSAAQGNLQCTHVNHDASYFGIQLQILVLASAMRADIVAVDQPRILQDLKQECHQLHLEIKTK
jgi:hypothetical protein